MRRVKFLRARKLVRLAESEVSEGLLTASGIGVGSRAEERPESLTFASVWNLP